MHAWRLPLQSRSRVAPPLPTSCGELAFCPAFLTRPSMTVISLEHLFACTQFVVNLGLSPSPMVTSRLTAMVSHGSTDRLAHLTRTKQLEVKGFEGPAKNVFCNECNDCSVILTRTTKRANLSLPCHTVFALSVNSVRVRALLFFRQGTAQRCTYG